MKKTLSLALAVALSSTTLIGCTKEEDVKEAPKADLGTSVENESKEVVEVAEGEIAKIGIGHITSIKKSKSLDGDKAPVGQVDTVIAAVGFDKDGKVVKATIDNAQTKVEFNTDLQLETDTTKPGKTKVELGDEYGMKKASTIGKEWYEQADALGQWMEGKTIDEIKSMKVKERDETHKNVPDEVDLTSSVTITVEDYIAAVEEAYNNAKEINPGAVELGLGTDISMKKSKSFGNKDGKDILPTAQVDTVMTVGAFDSNGILVGAIIDNAQTKVEFDKDGNLTSDLNAEIKTKVELGDEYGMKKASTIGKEWYEQADALGQWMEGKTIDEIKSMKVKERDETHKNVPDEVDLTSSVTITVEDYIHSIEKAKNNAK